MTAEKYLERIENTKLNSTPLYSRDEILFFAKKYAEHYHTEQLRLGVVVQQSELLSCETCKFNCDNWDDDHTCVNCAGFEFWKAT